MDPCRRPRPKLGGPYEITFKGKNTITIKNILAGEVWVCSGQSNMEMAVRSSANAEQEIAAANYPQIRLFTVEKKVAEKPLDDCKGKWVVCSPETVGGFSAAGYFFGRELHKELKQPIGLINTSWGGTPAEAWTSPVALQENPGLEPILTRYKKALEVLPEANAKYEESLAKWDEAVKQAKADGKQPPHRPGAPLGPDNPNSPSGLYNGMIAPLIPYAIRGAIWYQGESNAGRAYQYRDLFPTMIKSWWNAWGQEGQRTSRSSSCNWPTSWTSKEEPGDSAWAELREAQLMTLELPNTGMAVIIDIGDAKDIHPKNKQDVGKRLALWALANTYGKDVVYSGPLYKSMAKKGNNDRPELRSRSAAAWSPRAASRSRASPSPARTTSSSGRTRRSKATRSWSAATRSPTRSPCATPGRTTPSATCTTRRACRPRRSARTPGPA